MVHSSSATEAPRSVRIVLSAVETTSVSSATISDDTEARTRIHLCLEVMYVQTRRPARIDR